MQDRQQVLEPHAQPAAPERKIIPLFGNRTNNVADLAQLQPGDLPCTIGDELRKALLNVALLFRPEIADYSEALTLLLKHGLLRAQDIVQAANLMAVCRVSEMVQEQEVSLDPGTLSMMRALGCELIGNLRTLYDGVFSAMTRTTQNPKRNPFTRSKIIASPSQGNIE